jgi:CubicO group peptidase (beta-lactamase class C family)
MKTSLLTLAIIAVLCINLFSQHERSDRGSSEEWVMYDFSELELIDSTRLDFLIDSIMTADHIPGLTALINTKEDGIIWKRNYGYANVALQQPVEDSTLFHIVSISKTIIATAIMQFWEADSFDLDDNINDYLDDFQVHNPYHPNDTITFRMLMVHSSSINDNWNILVPLHPCGDSPVPLDSFLVNYFTPGGTYYSLANFNSWRPGTYGEWDYTSVGTAVLAYIVEKFSGTSFDQYCRNNIFNPLEMDKASWFLAGLDTTIIATPYEWLGGQYVANCHQGWPIYPSGFLRTTKFELEHFLSAYMNWGQYKGETILDSSTIDLMLSDHLGFPVPGDDDIQGLILYQNGRANERWPWGHEGGWIYGARTAMFFQQEEKWGIIFFMNRYFGLNSSTYLFLFNTLCDYAQEITAPQLPSAPILVLPIDSSNINSTTVEFVWKRSQPDVVTYWFELDTSDQFNSSFIDSTITDTSYIYSSLQINKRYWWKVKAKNTIGWGDFSEVRTFDVITGVESEIQLPIEFSLMQNYPNPFNPITTIKYSIKERSTVELMLYDVLGKEIKVLVNKEQDAGDYGIEFNAGNLVSGIYFYKLKAGSFVKTKKMILLK